MSVLNLAEILKDCPRGTKLYSSIFGEVYFEEIKYTCHAILIKVLTSCNSEEIFYPSGKYNTYYSDSEVTLFPSRDNRDWSTFKVEKPKFDVSSLQPFDKVLARDNGDSAWRINLFSHIDKDEDSFPFVCLRSTWSQCIPYNDETKHLLGTSELAPEFYVTWKE